MNILKSLLNTNSKQDTVNQSQQNLLQNKSREIVLIISALIAGCNCDTYWHESLEEGRCEETKEEESLEENAQEA